MEGVLATNDTYRKRPNPWDLRAFLPSYNPLAWHNLQICSLGGTMGLRRISANLREVFVPTLTKSSG
jgi:hypothetical protein